jgi:lipopolysaccharide export system protein LptA
MCRRADRSPFRAVSLAFAATVAALTALHAAALPEDRNQAIEITADKAVRDERAGFTVYSGDVILIQGSLHIEADKLTIFHDREAADRIVAEGQPARMRQQPAVDQTPVRAEANRIVYVKSTEQIVLTEAASIEQDGATVTGESIKYFMAEQLVRADASSEDSSSRVQVVIPAEVIEEQREDGENDGGGTGAEGS